MADGIALCFGARVCLTISSSSCRCCRTPAPLTSSLRSSRSSATTASGSSGSWPSCCMCGSSLVVLFSVIESLRCGGDGLNLIPAIFCFCACAGTSPPWILTGSMPLCISSRVAVLGDYLVHTLFLKCMCNGMGYAMPLK